MVNFLNKLFGPKGNDKTSSSETFKSKPVSESGEPDSGKAVKKEEVLIGAEVPTVPVSDEYVDDVLLEMVAAGPELETPQLIVGCSQSTGMQRDHNEDALFSMTMNLTKDGSNTTMGLFIVADGMGGHKHGELASEIAVRTVGSLVIQKVFMSLIGQQAQAPE
ncbi:PP2C family protein-serine/threonine phosphatase, partial [Chloroflexota bacterium]